MKKWFWIVILVIVGVGIGWCVWNRVQKQEISDQIPVISKSTEEKKIVKISVIADVHNDVDELKKALIQSGDNIVVIAGDLTTNGNKSELEKIKSVLDDGSKYYVVPGNHDIYKKQFLNVFEKNYQVIKVDNLKLILIDNSNWKGLGEEQKQWIETEVGECQVIRCLGVMHMPLEHSFTDHVMGEDSKVTAEEARWLHKILVDGGVREIFTGHLHYSTSYTLNNLKTTIVGAISKNRNNQTPRFTEIEWDGEEIKSEIIQLE